MNYKQSIKNNGQESKQAVHYDRLSYSYDKHYGDKYSKKYRTRFINAPLFEGINLKGKKVLEAMSGSGQTTDFLLRKKALVTGLDVSQQVIDNYKKKWKFCKTICKSILSTTLKSESFDVVVIVGGLHHVHPDVQKAIDEIYRVLKPGGHFCFMEPHSASFMNLLRRIWYYFDKDMFERNERAIDLNSIKQNNKKRFMFRKTNYLGGIAYFFILNSLVFRIPRKFKKYYSNSLMNIEKITSFTLTKFTAAYVVCQWEKR